MPLIPYKCPSCTGDIQVEDSRKTAFCMYCGTKFEITPPSNTKAEENSKKIEAYLELINAAFEGNNIEDVTKYCSLILEIDPKHSIAWMFMAISVIWGTNLQNLQKIRESFPLAKRAVEYASLDDKEEISGMILNYISNQLIALLNLASSVKGATNTMKHIHNIFTLWNDTLLSIPELSLEDMSSEVEKCSDICNKSKRAFGPPKKDVYTTAIMFNKRESYSLMLARTVKQKYPQYDSPVFSSKKGYFK